MGKLFTRSRTLMNICTRVRPKPSNNRGEFELDRTRSKNNIAENSFAPGHETHTTQNATYNNILNKQITIVLMLIFTMSSLWSETNIIMVLK